MTIPSKTGFFAFFLAFLAQFSFARTPDSNSLSLQVSSYVSGAQTPDSSSLPLPEIVVKANFPAYLAALQEQRAADGVVAVLNLDLPGRFPDLNPAEALDKLPGIALQRSHGEGRFVHIRGADPSFTTTQLNGEQIISPEGHNRFLQFDLMPVDQLRAVEVFKTNLPDQDGDAIGGSINLVTAAPRSGAPQWQAAVAGGFNPAAGLPNGQAQLSFNGRRMMWNASYWQDHRATENLETIWQAADAAQPEQLTVAELELRTFQIARRRLALSAEYAFPLADPDDELYLRGQFLDFQEENLRQRLRYRPGTGLSSATSDTIYQARIGRDLSYNRETERFLAVQSGFTHYLRPWTLDGAVAFSYGRESEPEGKSLDFNLPDATLLAQGDDPDFPQFKVLNGDAQDYNSYQLNELQTENDHSSDRSLTLKLNGRYGLRHPDDYFKFGVKSRLRHKSTRAEERIFDEYTGTAPINLSSLLEAGADRNVLGDRYPFGRRMDWDKTRALIDAHQNDFVLNETESALESTAGNFDVRETTTAAYGLASFGRGPWSGLAGLRCEFTGYDYRADRVDVQGNTVVRQTLAQTAKGHYAYLLPTVAVHFRPEKGIFWRAVLGASYARPTFDQLAPFELFNQLDNELLAGNPNLHPVFAWNADFFAEKTLSGGGSLSLGLFGKHLQNFIFTQQSRDTILWNGSPRAVLKTAPTNGEGAWLAGAELSWQQRLSFLPGAWSGLGVYANYTYTWSRASLAEEEEDADEEGSRLPGQAAHSGNFALWYDRGRWSGRAALNFQSDFLLQAGEPEEGVSQLLYGASLQLDATLSYRLSPSFLLFAEGMNLLNTPLEYFSGDENHRSKYERYGVWGRLGVKMNW